MLYCTICLLYNKLFQFSDMLYFNFSKTSVWDHNKPLYICAGSDSFQSIGMIINEKYSHLV